MCVCVCVCVCTGIGLRHDQTKHIQVQYAICTPPPPLKNLLSPAFSISTRSLCGIWSVRMKEALSKRLILGRLVNASRLKAGNAATPPSLNPPSGNGSPQVSIQYVSLEKNGCREVGLGGDFHMRQNMRGTRQEQSLNNPAQKA